MNINFDEDGIKTYKSAAIWIGIGAYATVILLTASHNYNLIVAQAIVESLRWVAVIGFLGLELNAIALPLAIHFWTVTPKHKRAAKFFYGVDILLLYANSLIDVKIVTGAPMPEWGNWYLQNVAQVSPIITMVIWAILFSLDPAQENREKMLRLKQQTMTVALKKVQSWFDSVDFEQQIANRGDEIGQHILREVFDNPYIFKEKDTPLPPGDERPPASAGNLSLTDTAPRESVSFSLGKSNHRGGSEDVNF